MSEHALPPPAGPLLLTGASGFLGGHVLRVLARRTPARRIVALVRDPDRWGAADPAASADVELLQGSLEEPGAWLTARALAGLGGILHLGARVEHGHRHAAALQRTNVEGTRALAALAAERGCRMVFASTSGTVGCFASAEQSADEDAPYCEACVGAWPYYRSKIEAERAALAIARERAAQIVVLRPPILLGPDDHRLRSSKHVLRLLEGRLPFLVRGGVHFVDVRDVAEATVRALERPQVRPIYHLPGTACTTHEFYAWIAELAGVAAPRLTLPYPLARTAARLIHGLADALHADALRVVPEPVLIEMAHRYWGLTSRHAAAELGFTARPPRETLRDTIEWLQGRRGAGRPLSTAAAEPVLG